MTEIRADDTINAKPLSLAEGEEISDQNVALPEDQPNSITSPTQSCTGSSNPFEEPSFVDDDCGSDGTMANLSFE